MVDFTNFGEVINFIFGGVDTTILGDIGLMAIFLLAIVLGLLAFFNANKFTTMAFLSVLLIAMAGAGYGVLGWVAPLGALLLALVFFMAFMKWIN